MQSQLLTDLIPRIRVSLCGQAMRRGLLLVTHTLWGAGTLPRCIVGGVEVVARRSAAGSSSLCAATTPAAASATIRSSAGALASSFSTMASSRSSSSSAGLQWAGLTPHCRNVQPGIAAGMGVGVAASGSGSGLRSSLPWQQMRMRTSSAHLVPKFKGGKIKPYSSLKHRFKVTATGKVLYPRPGYVHKRFNKSKRQLGDLSRMQIMKLQYAKTVKKLGFRLRHF